VWATEVVHCTAIRADLDRAHRNSQKVQFLRDKLVKLTYLAEDKGFEQNSDTKENTGENEVLKKRVINPTQGQAETLAELLDIIADADAETLVELVRMAKQVTAESQ